MFKNANRDEGSVPALMKWVLSSFVEALEGSG
jgi:hypothetical protein